jgi:simple sugar transport system permease protein
MAKANSHGAGAVMTIADVFTVAFLTTWLNGGVRLAVPVLFSALGEMVNQRSGITNLGLEGVMLISCLVGFATSYYSGSALIGTLAAMATGLMSGLLLGFMYITLRTQQTVVGFIFNLFAIGLTTFGYRAAFGLTMIAPQARTFPKLPVPVLSTIPFLGQILFQHHILVYLMPVFVAVFYILLYRTKFGLKIRAVGEHPRAADTAGISVPRIRYVCMAIGGAMQGLAGAALVLGQLGVFRDNVTAGRGFIGLAIVIFGRWNPLTAVAAALVFGSAESLAISLQLLGSPVPPQFLLMLPYVVAAVAMSGIIGGRVFAPACLGQPYTRE